MLLSFSIPCKGNGKSLGLIDGNGHYGSFNIGSGSILYENSNYNVTLPYSQSGAPFTNQSVLGVTTNASASGIVTNSWSASISSKKLGNFYIKY